VEAADDWQRLVDALDEWTAAVESAPGRIHVLLPDGHNGADAIIVMTPDQWDDMSGVMWGNFDDALKDVKRTLLGLGRGEHFAVYCEYGLEPSTEATLPEPPHFTPEPGGTWVAVPTKGRLEGRPNED
jgi:hypothetical protein